MRSELSDGAMAICVRHSRGYRRSEGCEECAEEPYFMRYKPKEDLFFKRCGYCRVHMKGSLEQRRSGKFVASFRGGPEDRELCWTCFQDWLHNRLEEEQIWARAKLG